MRRIKIIFIIAFAFIFLTSCKDKKRDEPLFVLDEKEVAAYILENVNTAIIDDLKLPKKYEDIDIVWTSLMPAYITDDGTILKRNTKQITDIEMWYDLNDGITQVTGSVIFHLYPRTFDFVSSYFARQIGDQVFENLDYLEDNYLDLYTISWTSSDQTCLTNDGEYIKPEIDKDVVITYILEAGGQKKEYTKEIKVLGQTDKEKVKEVYTWLQLEVLDELYVSTDLNLPTIDPVYEVSLTWSSSNESVITSEGKVKQYVFERYVELRVAISKNDALENHVFWITVEPLDISKMTEKEILENYLSAIALPSISRLNFQAYDNITQSFNNLYFFTSDNPYITEHIAPLDKDSGNDNRPGVKKTTTEFVVVHDTANNGTTADGMAHARYVEQGGGGTSFHYVVGNDGIYHLIPDDEIAYHAGDGRRTYELFDTGVKAVTKRANIAISDNGYYTFNGVESKVHVPSGANSYSSICSSGIFYTIGANGNYYINDTYYNTTFGFISNCGGNRNSIGIETCVNKTSDYALTVRYNTRLVAKLLMDNNLTVDRVLQHNNMSGKPCPMAMRVAGYWQNFRDSVSLEKFGMEHFKDYEFIWTSNSPILSNTGFINKALNGTTEVSYSVTIKKAGNVILTNTYITKLA